jgi:positive regulator of sigma E activity
MKLDDDSKKLIKKSLRFLIQFSIIGYLIYQLFEIGFQKIIESLPQIPSFYLLYFVIYFSLPLAEVIIYKIKWPITFRDAFPVFIQKKVLNTDVVGYSGELFLYMWAKKYLKNPAKQVFIFIKDNNVLSSLASGIVTIFLLIFFISQGYINISDYLGDVNGWSWILLSVGAIIALLLIYRFRKAILALNRYDSMKIFSLHAGRIIFINVIQILQWHIARPDIAIPVWFTFSAVQILASRIPFLPSTDALFVNVALEISGVVSVPKEALVGILTANLILKRILNVVSYLISKYVGTDTDVKPSKEEIDLERNA